MCRRRFRQKDLAVGVGVLELVMGARRRVGPVAVLVDCEGSVDALLGAGDEQLGAVDVRDGEGARGCESVDRPLSTREAGPRGAFITHL